MPYFGLFCFVSAPIGLAVSLLALLPPFQKLARRSQRVKVTVLLLFGLLAFVIGFVLLTWLGAIGNYALGETNLPAAGVFLASKTAIVNELWVRRMVPPSLRRPCYARREAVCRQADVVVSGDEAAWGQETYWTMVGTAFLSALISGLLVLFMTPRSRRGAR